MGAHLAWHSLFNSLEYRFDAGSGEVYDRWMPALRQAAGLVEMLESSVVARRPPVNPVATPVPLTPAPTPTPVGGVTGDGTNTVAVRRPPPASLTPTSSGEAAVASRPASGVFDPAGLPHTASKAIANAVDPAAAAGAEQAVVAPDSAQLLAFVQDYQSRFWFSYRRDFERIEPSYFTTDVGWGCMLRTAQMLLAQAFSSLLLSRGTVGGRAVVVRWFAC